MQKFTKITFYLIYSLSVNLLFSGCFLGGEDNSASDAPFSLTEIKGEYNSSQSEGNVFPENFTLTFKDITISIKSTGRAIQESVFLVSNRETIPIKGNQIKFEEISSPEYCAYLESQYLAKKCTKGDSGDYCDFLNQAITYHFNICDDTFNDSIIDDFKEEDPQEVFPNYPLSSDNPIAAIKTDEYGKVANWIEEYPWVYHKKSGWIPLSRNIKQIETEGVLSISTNVNPWLQIEEYKNLQVVDTRHVKDPIIESNLLIKSDESTPKDAGLQFLENNRKNKANITMEIIHFSYVQTDYAEKFRNESTGRGVNWFPKIKGALCYGIIDINGKLQCPTISSGRFNMKTRLLITAPQVKKNNNSNLQETEEVYQFFDINAEERQEIETRFSSDGKIHNIQPIHWKLDEIKTSTTYWTYVELIPKDSTKQRVHGFKGVYPIGEQDSLPQNVQKESELVGNLIDTFENLFFENNPSQTKEGTAIKNALGILEKPPKHLASSRHNTGVPSFSIGELKDQFGGVENETWLERKITTQFSGPLFHNAEILEDGLVFIKVIDLSSGQIDTTYGTLEPTPVKAQNGILSFNIETTQKWYKKERYFLKLIEIYDPLHDQRRNQKQARVPFHKVVAINPWDYGFTHAYDVTDSLKVKPTTCLTENKNTLRELEKIINRYKNLDKELVLSSQKDNKETKKHLEIIEQVFCKNKKNKQNQNLWTYFGQFLATVFPHIHHPNKNTHHSIDKKKNQTPKAEQFTDKLTSVVNVSPAQSFIHLFRSQKTSLIPGIDNALNLHLTYNIRFHFQPRIVRYDGIRSGQQNKGPLRDGVYLLNMAVLKGEGDKNHNSSSNHASHTDIKSANSYSPYLDGEPALIEDFIVPYSQHVVEVKDGTVKTDVYYPVPAEKLIFANSKNNMIFQLEPAQPVCELSNPSDHCYDENGGLINQAQNISLTSTKQKKNPVPAKFGKDYDMIFHSYKVPFVPSKFVTRLATNEFSKSDEQDAYNKIKQFYEEANANQIREQICRRYDDFSKNIEVRRQRFNQSHRRKLENQSSDTFNGSTIRIGDPSYRQTVKTVGNSQLRETQIAMDNFAAEQLREVFETDINIHSICSQNQKTSLSHDIASQLSKGEESFLEESLKPLMTSAEDTFWKDIPEWENGLSNMKNMVHNLKRSLDKLKQEGQVTAPDQNKTDDFETADIENFIQLISFLETLIPETYAFCTLANNIYSNKDTREKLGQFSKTLLPEQTVSTFFNTIDRIQKDKKEDCNTYLINNTKNFMYKLFSQLNSQIFHLHIKTASLSHIEKPKTDKEKDHSLNHIAGFAKNNNLCLIHTDDSINHQAKEKGIVCNTDIHAFLSDLNRQIDHLNTKISGGANKDFENSLQAETLPDKMSLLPDLSNIKDARHIQNVLSSQFHYTPAQGDFNLEEIGPLIHGLCGVWFTNFYSGYSDVNLIAETYKNTLRESILLRAKNVSDHFKYLCEKEEEACSKKMREWQSQIENILNEYNTQLSGLTQLFNQIQTFDNENWDNVPPELHKVKGLLHQIKESISNQELLIDHPSFWSGYKAENSQTKSAPATPASSNHPFKKCLKNPFHFFGFEKKTIIGKIKESRENKGKGSLTELQAGMDFMFNTQKDQGGNRDFAIGVGPGLSLGEFASTRTKGTNTQLGESVRKSGKAVSKTIAKVTQTAKRVSWFNLPFLASSANFNFKAYEGTGMRRLRSAKVTEGMRFHVEHTQFDITLEKNHYHRCLVIRPRFSAFEMENDNFQHIWTKTAEQNPVVKALYEKMGMLLCTTGRADTMITEDFYYIYPKINVLDDVNIGLTVDANTAAIRTPLSISIRGEKNYQTFHESINCYLTDFKNNFNTRRSCQNTYDVPFSYFLNKKLEFAKNLKNSVVLPKLTHLTHISPGVYAHAMHEPEFDPSNNDDMIDDLINYFKAQWDVAVEGYAVKEPSGSGTLH